MSDQLRGATRTHDFVDTDFEEQQIATDKP